MGVGINELKYINCLIMVGTLEGRKGKGGVGKSGIHIVLRISCGFAIFPHIYFCLLQFLD